MKIYDQALSKGLCDELYNFGLSYFFAKEISPHGFPRPVVTKTNYAWSPDIVKDSKPVVIYFVEGDLKARVVWELVELGVFTNDDEVSPMVYVWTPGSYIPQHNDGNAHDDRKTVTAYLNPSWDVRFGGMYHYLDKNSNKWEMLIPKQGLLVYNDQDEAHYTTPVNENWLRVSLQMFGYRRGGPAAL